MKLLFCLLLSFFVFNLSYATSHKAGLPIVGFDPPEVVKRALDRKGIQTMGEATLINDQIEARRLLGQLQEPYDTWLLTELKGLGLSFGCSPFRNLIFRERLLLYRAGAKSKYDLVKYGNFLEDQIDSGSVEDRLTFYSPKLRAMITSVRALDPRVEVNAKLKTLTEGLEDFLQLIYSQEERGLQAFDLDTETVHKTTAHLETVREILTDYQQQAECRKTIQNGS